MNKIPQKKSYLLDIIYERNEILEDNLQTLKYRMDTDYYNSLAFVLNTMYTYFTKKKKYDKNLVLESLRFIDNLIFTTGITIPELGKISKSICYTYGYLNTRSYSEKKMLEEIINSLCHDIKQMKLKNLVSITHLKVGYSKSVYKLLRKNNLIFLYDDYHEIANPKLNVNFIQTSFEEYKKLYKNYNKDSKNLYFIQEVSKTPDGNYEFDTPGSTVGSIDYPINPFEINFPTKKQIKEYIDYRKDLFT